MQNFESSNIHNLLISVDVQNDFVSGSLAIEGGEQVVDPINQLSHAVRENMGQVALTRDWHPSLTPHFESWPVHCVARTNGAEFESSLDIRDQDIILSKGMGQTDGYSGIEAVADNGETLESIIEARSKMAQKVRVFIGGLATDYCVKATAIDLARRFERDLDIDIYAVTDAMRAVNIQPHDDEEAIKSMAEAGVNLTNLTDALDMINQNDVNY